MTELDADEGAEARYREVKLLSLRGEGVLERLVSNLSDPSWRVRKATVERLVEYQPPTSVVPLLLKRLADGDDASARNAAANALAAIGAPAVEALADRLRSDDPDIRKFAADVLGDIGLLDGIDGLMRALEDGDRNVKSAAAEALGKIGGLRAAVALERALRVEDHLVRACALDGLSRMGAIPSLGALEQLSRDRFLRRPVYRLLGRVRAEGSLELLLRGLSNAGRATQAEALAAIAEQARTTDGLFMGRLAAAVRKGTSPAIAHSARAALESGRGRVAEGAIIVLGALNSFSDAGAIAQRAEDPGLADVALTALGCLGADALPALRAAVPGAGANALKVLSLMLPALDAPLLERRALELLGSDDPEAEGLLVELLGRLGGEASGRALLGRVGRHELSAEWSRALRQILHRSTTAMLPLVQQRWSASPSPELASLLGSVGGAEARAQLMVALRSEDPHLRAGAALALGEEADALSAAEEVALRQAGFDEVESVRAAAVQTLGHRAGGRVGDVLTAALSDPSDRVRVAALGSLPPGTEHRAAIAAMVSAPVAELSLAALASLDRLGLLTLEVLEAASVHPNAEVVRTALIDAATLPGGMRLVESRLTNPSWEVRRAAARVLGRTGTHQQLVTLRAREAAEDDPLVAEAIQQAIADVAAQPRR